MRQIVRYGVVAMVGIASAFAQEREESFFCSASKIIAGFGDTVTLAAAPISKGDQVRWAVTSGSIVTAGDQVTWKLEGLPEEEDSQTAFAVLHDSKGSRRNCSVEVWLSADPVRGGGQEAGRAFLTPRQSEQAGFGVYSYVVFGRRVTEKNRPLYESVMRAHLELVGPLIGLEANFKGRDKLGAAYVPVLTTPPAEVTSAKVQSAKELAENAHWVVNNYDYDRMRAIVDGLPKRLSDGPYLVSSTRPLTQGGGLVIELDLGFITPDVADLWVREFLAMETQEHSWSVQTARNFALKARTFLAILAKNVPEVKSSLQEWLTFTDGLKSGGTEKKP